MNNAQLYLGTDLLDFNQKVNVKLLCYDMRDPEIGNSNKSYTLEIPLTRGNKNILEHAHLINSRKQITQRARLTLGGIELIRGLPRVLNIFSTVIRIIIDSDDWVDGITGTSLRQLSWDSGDQHTFNATNIEASWVGVAKTLYRYPLINFAELFTEEFGAESGVVPNDFVAMWNISLIVEKIFEDAGYVLASGFFDKAATIRRYVLSEEQVADDDFLEEKGLEVNATNDADNLSTITHPAGVSRQITLSKGQINMNTKVLDEGVDWSTVTDIYTVPVTGTYRFKAETVIYCDHNEGSFTISTQTFNFFMFKDAVTIAEYQGSGTDQFDNTTVYKLDSGWVHMEAGDEVFVLFSGQSTATNDGAEVDVDLYLQNAVTKLENTWDKRNLYKGVGYTMDPALLLPDIDSLDFLIGLKELFNLRFWFDQYNKTVYIETDPDFVGSTVVDWTNKVDYSKGIDQEIIAASYSKNQVWQYAPDSNDKAYTGYVAENGIPFTKELTLTNASVKPGTKTRINTVFSPTVAGNMSQIAAFSEEVPRIFGSEEFKTGRPYPQYRAKKWNPRIVSWQSGTSSLTTGSWRWYESMQDFIDGVSTLKSTFPEVFTLDLETSYTNNWAKSFHYIDGSRLGDFQLVLSPSELISFLTVVGTPANEGFRATYKLNDGETDMYYYITQIVFDGVLGKVLLVQKM